MDLYSGYNQIPMNRANQDKTTFTTDQRLYYYQVMPFELKKARATYQKLVNKMFAPLIGKSIEVFVDDMMEKSKHVGDHIGDLKDCFDVLRQYQMKLNPIKCAFEVESGKFLGFMVNHRGIEINPIKAQAMVDLQPPWTVKEVQRQTRIVVILSRLVSNLLTSASYSSKHSRARLESIGTTSVKRRFEVSKYFWQVRPCYPSH